MKNHQRRHAAAAIVAAFSLLLQPLTPLLVAQAPAAQTPKPATPSAQPGAKPAAPAAPAAAAAPIDGGWPRFFDAAGGSVLLYQPQISSWDNQKHLVAFSAVSFRQAATGKPATGETATGQPATGQTAPEKPAVGTVKLEADTKVSVADRLVSLSAIKVTEANFQTLS